MVSRSRGFCVEASWFTPERRPPLPDTEELIELAKMAATDDQPYAAPVERG
jgi:hypothetical protein